MYLPKLCILSHQRYRGLIQYISQTFPPTVADPAFPIMFSGIIRHNGISCQLLKLFGIVKTSNVPDFCYKAADRHHSNSLNRQQVIYIWDLFQLFFHVPEQFLLPCCIYIHVSQKVFQFHTGGFRRFRTSYAMLCRRYQGLCPLHSSASQLCVPPYPVHAFHSQFSDVLRQRCFLQHLPPAHRLQIPINLFIFRKVDGEPSGQAVLDPRELLLRLEPQV